VVRQEGALQAFSNASSLSTLSSRLGGTNRAISEIGLSNGTNGSTAGNISVTPFNSITTTSGDFSRDQNRYLNIRTFSNKAANNNKEESEEASKAETAGEDAKADDQEQKEEAAAETGEEEQTSSAGTEEEKVISREEQLENELKDMKNQLLRSLAEQENTRRIAQRDVESARNFAIKSFAKSLLDVSDNLSRALDAVPEELREDKNGNPVLATLYEGIKMTESGLTKSFESNGLVKFGEVGEMFDPNKHEALYEYPDPNKQVGSVGQIMKVGFMLNKRVLRPAEVGVVKKV